MKALGEAKRGRANPVLLAAALLAAGLLWRISWSGGGSALSAGAPRYTARSECPAYASVVQAAMERSEGKPQLTEAQLLWIASLVHGQRSRRPGDIRFLVFGAGFDSNIWQAINCHGRTAFLESSKEWMGKIAAANPQLELHHVRYKGRIATAEEFFKEPWLMAVPDSVDGTCWDVILVDAPVGVGDKSPGRMESSWWALNNARRCIKEGRLGDVVILLHDLQRPMEQEIARRMFGPDAPHDGLSVVALGLIRGLAGDLTAWRLGPPVSSERR